MMPPKTYRTVYAKGGYAMDPRDLPVHRQPRRRRGDVQPTQIEVEEMVPLEPIDPMLQHVNGANGAVKE